MTSFSESNRQAWKYVSYFQPNFASLTQSSNLSAEYNTKPWQQKISRQVAEALQQRRDWIGARWTGTDDTGRDVRLLDYACGTGSITNALAPYVNTIRGIDVSENMVEKYNEAARQSGMTSDHCCAIVGDLFTDTVPDHLTGPDLYQFDLAVIGLGFHHFEKPGLAVQRLVERLKPGEGVLVIVDFLPFSKDDHDGGGARHTIKTHGFDKAAMEKMYKDAGLEEFGFDVLSEPAVMEFDSGTKKRDVFIAKGKRQKGVWGKLAGWVGGLQEASSGQFAVGPRPDPRPVEQLDQFGRRLETVQSHPARGYDKMGRRIEDGD